MRCTLLHMEAIGCKELKILQLADAQRAKARLPVRVQQNRW
jgi:hypothetical protein